MFGRWSAFALVWILLIVKGAISVDIKKLSVPDYVLIDTDNKTDDHVILDCDFELDDKGKPSFVLKWFKDDVLIYQWISGHKPQALASMKEQIDTSYETSSDDSYKYRGIYIDDVNIKNSGKYKCVVSTSSSIDQEEKSLKVIDISQDYSLEVLQRIVDNKTEVACVAKNIYPKPELSLTDDNKPVKVKSDDVTKNSKGLYTVKIAGFIDDDDADNDGIGNKHDDDDDNDGIKDIHDDDDDNDGIKDDKDDDDDNDGVKDHDEDDHDDTDSTDTYKCTLVIPGTKFKRVAQIEHCSLSHACI
ncbi:hypothetical protein ACFFRR_009475 [Megaselia abdita]